MITEQVTIYQHPTMPTVWLTTDGRVFVAAPIETSNGYVIASVRRGTRRLKRAVHALMLECFVGPRPAGAITRHLNGKKDDNRNGNLAWGTQKENALDSVLHGTTKSGERNRASKLTAAEVSEIVARKEAGEAVTELAHEFDVKVSTLRDIFAKRTWASKDPAYKVWASMIQRCENPATYGWKWYGARGIKVCDRWRFSFTDFLADVGPRPSLAHTLDRYPNNDGHYEPGNVRWATRIEQRHNRR